jgi:gluconokinase
VPRDVLAARLRDRPGHFAGPELLSSQLETLELGDDVITERNTAPIDDVVEQVTRLVRDAVGES